MDYLLPFKKYATFSGRASRREYWMFVLMFHFVPLFLFLLFFILSLSQGVASNFHNTIDPNILFILPLFALYQLFLLLPSLAVGVRRLHDTNKSGWWMLISFIPFGSLILLVFFILPSTPGRNQYDTDTTSTEGQQAGTMGASAQNAVDQGLQNYIQKSREAGKTDVEIKATLLSNSWPEANVDNALKNL